MKNRLRVVFLGSFPNRENPSKGIFNFRAANQLCEHSEINVISIRTWHPGRKFIQTEDHGRFKVHHLSIPHYPADGLFIHRLSTWSVCTFLFCFLGGVIQKSSLIHSVSGSYGIYGAFLGKKFDKPHILQLTGSDVNSEFPKLLELNYVRQLPKNISLVVGNSKQLVSAFNKLFDSSFPLYHAYRGIDLSEFKYKAMPSEPGINFLFLGGLDQYRGLKHEMNTKGGLSLMNAWKRAEKELYTKGAKLFWGGSNSDCEVFQNWRQSLIYPEQVELVGKLSPSEVIAAYHRANVIVVPSMEEGLPNVAVEAAACGRPALGSNTGGIPEVIEAERTGWLFPPGDDQALSKCLLSISENPVHLESFGQSARKKMEGSFDHRQFAQSYLNYYNMVCAE